MVKVHERNVDTLLAKRGARDQLKVGIAVRAEALDETLDDLPVLGDALARHV